MSKADEIKVGEYVRTEEGYIGKYKKDGLVKHTVEIEDNQMSWITGEHNIVKHSKNIIDLIEVGDYVNGERINEKFYDYANNEYHLVTKANKHYFKENIKSILTKEMFEANVYKLEE